MSDTTLLSVVLAFSPVGFCIARGDNRRCHFSDGETVGHVYKKELPTPWFKRIFKGYLTAWVTHLGGIEVFQSDPETNTLVNPREISGNFCANLEESNEVAWINNFEKKKGEDPAKRRIPVVHPTHCTREKSDSTGRWTE